MFAQAICTFLVILSLEKLLNKLLHRSPEELAKSGCRHSILRQEMEMEISTLCTSSNYDIKQTKTTCIWTTSCTVGYKHLTKVSEEKCQTPAQFLMLVWRKPRCLATSKKNSLIYIKSLACLSVYVCICMSWFWVPSLDTVAPLFK